MAFLSRLDGQCSSQPLRQELHYARFMCLIALAHRASPRFPLVIAANRDEDYQRATHDAHHWPDAPDVVGGRDGLYGGTWLAVRRGGRFAAVTNLRGAERKTRSRGF